MPSSSSSVHPVQVAKLTQSLIGRVEAHEEKDRKKAEAAEAKKAVRAALKVSWTPVCPKLMSGSEGSDSLSLKSVSICHCLDASEKEFVLPSQNPALHLGMETQPTLVTSLLGVRFC